MKINKIRAAGIGCLAAMTGLVTAASMVLTAPADAAKARSQNGPAAAAEAAPGPHSGSCVADSTSVCSGSGVALDNSVSSGDAVALHGSVASGCSTAIDNSTASGGNPCPTSQGKGAPTAGPAKAVSGNPSFAG